MLTKTLIALPLVAVSLPTQSAAAPGSAGSGGAMPMRVTGPWTVSVGPGTVTLGGRRIVLRRPATIKVPRPLVVPVRDERCEALPVFKPNEGPWQMGVRLRQVIPVDCGGDTLVVPGTVRVKPAPGDAKPFAQGKDYDMNVFWSALGRLDGGSIPPDTPVFFDYDYSPLRLGSVVASADGDVYLVQGTSVLDAALPPCLIDGEVVVGNIWLGGRVECLTDENVYPVQPESPKPAARGRSVAEALLPKTLAKLRSGQEVVIVAWGDSVTKGGGLESPYGENRDLWYQSVFASRLQARFPKAKIRMLTASWPGNISKNYFEARSGGAQDFIRDVIDPKPDLVTAEWVNDAGLDEAGVRDQYGKWLAELRANGSEVILIAPHLVHPTFMGCGTLKLVDDPRPYVAALRKFAHDNNIALADVSAAWLDLRRKGIPYTTLSKNAHNHPDARGHRMFADVLMGLFPRI